MLPGANPLHSCRVNKYESNRVLPLHQPHACSCQPCVQPHPSGWRRCPWCPPRLRPSSSLCLPWHPSRRPWLQPSAHCCSGFRLPRESDQHRQGQSTNDGISICVWHKHCRYHLSLVLRGVLVYLVGSLVLCTACSTLDIFPGGACRAVRLVFGGFLLCLGYLLLGLRPKDSEPHRLDLVSCSCRTLTPTGPTTASLAPLRYCKTVSKGQIAVLSTYAFAQALQAHCRLSLMASVQVFSLDADMLYDCRTETAGSDARGLEYSIEKCTGFLWAFQLVSTNFSLDIRSV